MTSSREPTTHIRFHSFPRTVPPPTFIHSIVRVFVEHEDEIGTEGLQKGLKSDDVLAVLRPGLVALGFDVESGKKRAGKIDRPVFFGEGGEPVQRYEIDAFQPDWGCALEVEAGRAWMGNAFYRDLIQAAVMVGVDHLCVAVSNVYRYKGSTSPDYRNVLAVAESVFGHTRLTLPYGLTVIGY